MLCMKESLFILWIEHYACLDIELTWASYIQIYLLLIDRGFVNTNICFKWILMLNLLDLIFCLHILFRIVKGTWKAHARATLVYQEKRTDS